METLFTFIYQIYFLNYRNRKLSAYGNTIYIYIHCQSLVSTVENDSVSELFSFFLVFSSSEDLVEVKLDLWLEAFESESEKMQ